MTKDILPPLVETRPGPFRHYKGELYEVVGTTRHGETLAPMTLYRAQHGERGPCVRPAAMFAEGVLGAGVRQQRFKPLAAEALQK